jgi:hypothetical protein
MRHHQHHHHHHNHERPHIAGSAPATEWSAGGGAGLGATRKQILHWTRIARDDESVNEQRVQFTTADSSSNATHGSETYDSSTSGGMKMTSTRGRVRSMSKSVGGMSASFKNILETLPEVPILNEEVENVDDEEEDASEGRPIEDTRDYPNPEVYLSLGGSSLGATALAQASSDGLRALRVGGDESAAKEASLQSQAEGAMRGDTQGNGNGDDSGVLVNPLIAGVRAMEMNRGRLASEDDDGMLFDME